MTAVNPHTQKETGTSEAPSVPDSASTASILTALRRFHLGGPPPSWGQAPTGLLPRMLAAFREDRRVRHDFPLVLFPTAEPGAAWARPLREAFSEWAAQAGDRVLIDNAVRLERDVCDAFEEDPSNDRVRELAGAAGRKLLGELNLNAEHTKALEGSLASFLGQVPDDARLLGFDGATAPRLAVEALRASVTAAGTRLHERVQELHAGLDRLLTVDRAKDPSTWSADADRSADGRADSLLDMARMAEVVGTPRGVQRLDEARRARIESAHGVLAEYLAQPAKVVASVVSDSKERSQAIPASDDVAVQSEPDVCGAVEHRFDDEASLRLPLYRAIRVARLEIDDTYDASQHDPWFEQFDVEALDDEELSSIPAVCGFTTREALLKDGGAALSGLLRSGRPVHLFVWADPLAGVAEVLDGPDSPLDLGYLAIGHRTTFVHQSTAARPEHFIEGVRKGHASLRPALHLMAAPPAAAGIELDPWLLVGAALEGRAHPLFVYDPSQGATWAERFSIDGNPNPELGWTVSESAPVEGPASDEGEAAVSQAFTYADFATLESACCARQLRAVPEDYESPDLVSVGEMLAASDEDQSRKVPFVWAVDPSGEAARYVVTRRLLAACRDRLDFWRTLQELAGVQNHYVLQAIARVREEADAASKAALEAAEAAHREETERVRRDVSGEALQHLARALTSADPSELLSAAGPVVARSTPAAPTAPVGSPGSTDAPAADVASETVEAEAAKPAPAAAVAEDPWIDTPLCTSCNDCRNINPLLFLYDDSKQAYIGDPRSGTFDELVRAAEKCPARCIHPGTPLDPNEPGLDELIERAAPFN